MRLILWLIATWSEKLCCLTHWATPILIRIGLGYCHLARFSAWLDGKYHLGVWTGAKGETDWKGDINANNR